MKITNYKAYAVYANFRNWVFIRMETDEGIYGVGEATVEWKTNAVLGALEDLRPYVIGADPRRFEWHFFECFRELYWRIDPVTLSAIAGLELAMVDITGKYYNLPAYQFFGGKLRDNIRFYGNGWWKGAKTIEDFAQKAKSSVESGATGLKWDPFGKSYLTISNDELERVVNTVACVRETIGTKIDLMIEGHGRFNVHTAIRIAKALAPYSPYYFEEPVTPDVIEDTVEVHRKSPIPIATGERFLTKYMYRELLEKKGADYLQPDVIHVGGMTELKKIAGMAEAYNVQLAPHNPNGPVAAAANLHLCAVIPNCEVLELMIHDATWRTEISTEIYNIQDGYISIPDTPGLGIDLNIEAMEKYPQRFTPQNLFNDTLYQAHESGTHKKLI